MKTYRVAAATALYGMASVAGAGGLDRGSQSVQVLFEEGTYLEVSAGYVDPSIKGQNRIDGRSVDNVGEDYWALAGAFKFDITPELAAALIVNEPYGGDLNYPSDDVALGGTEVDVDSFGITGVLKYSLPAGVSVYGGARRVRVGGDVTLQGAGYGPISGYQMELSDEWGTGYVAGLAYEIPDIALRVAATYHSSISYEANTRESGPAIPVAPGVALPLLDGTNREGFKIPERWQLEAQTGIAPNTLLTAEVLHVPHSDVDISPQNFETVTQRSLTTYGDTTYYELGLGHRFTDTLAASFDVFYEETDDDTFSPLQVTSDYWGIGLGTAIDLTERVTLSLGLRRIWFDDTTVELQGNDLVRFDDATAWAGGMKLGVHF